MLSQAKLEKVDPFEIARKYEARFHADLAALNIQPGDPAPVFAAYSNLAAPRLLLRRLGTYSDLALPRLL
jgi:hypothetical protein